MKFPKNKYTPFIVFSLLCMIWSSTWVAIKIGLESLPPFISVGIRFFIASLLLLLYARLLKVSFPRDLKTHLFFIYFGAVNFTGGYSLVYWGEQFIDSGLGSVLFSVMPFYVLILSIWLLPEEKVTLNKFAGVLLGICGIIVIFWDQINFGDGDKFAIYGMIAFLISPLFSSVGTIMGKKASRTIHPVILNTLPIFYASVTFFIFSFFLERDIQFVFDSKAILSILYLAIFGTSIAFVLYFWMLKNQSAVIMSMITFVTPALALVWGWLLLDEKITHFLIIGLLLIFAGIFIARKDSMLPRKKTVLEMNRNDK